MSGIKFEMGSNSICLSLAGIVVDLVCLCTQLLLFQNHLQYKPFNRTIMPNTEIEVPMVESIFTLLKARNYELKCLVEKHFHFIEGQEL